MKIPYFIVPLTTVLMAHPSYSQVGGDKELVLTLNGSVTNELLGTDLAHAGDANGDGYDDLLVSTGSDVARLYSGMDGTIIYEWALGNSVANLGDIDHDGTDDFGIGGSNNSATVISGATNTVIYSLTGPSFSQFGKSVASAGDLDLDGTPDFLVGAPGVDINGWGTAGACLAFSGATGMQLFYLPTPNPRHWGQFGWSVFSPGDLNSDGYPDLIVEAIGDANAAEEPKVYIFSGKDQSQLAYYNWGSQARSTGDVDGDGVGDYSLIYSGADAEVRSGATHNIL